uniref:Uncharacterized protein n=1 Tax=Anopheles albimanus TaxID=7167 RepID=A0A182FZE8_ANOAL
MWHPELSIARTQQSTHITIQRSVPSERPRQVFWIRFCACSPPHPSDKCMPPSSVSSVLFVCVCV